MDVKSHFPLVFSFILFGALQSGGNICGKFLFTPTGLTKDEQCVETFMEQIALASCATASGSNLIIGILVCVLYKRIVDEARYYESMKEAGMLVFTRVAILNRESFRSMLKSSLTGHRDTEVTASRTQNNLGQLSDAETVRQIIQKIKDQQNDTSECSEDSRLDTVTFIIGITSELTRILNSEAK